MASLAKPVKPSSNANLIFVFCFALMTLPFLVLTDIRIKQYKIAYSIAKLYNQNKITDQRQRELNLEKVILLQTDKVKDSISNKLLLFRPRQRQFKNF